MSDERSFPNNARAVTDARRFAIDALDGAAPLAADAVALMVSELAANAVLHSASHFTVTIDRGPEQIRVAVRDNGPGDPIVRSPEPNVASGRGLQIVEKLATEWGVLPSPDGPGKTVWFTVAVDADPHTVARRAATSTNRSRAQEANEPNDDVRVARNVESGSGSGASDVERASAGQPAPRDHSYARPERGSCTTRNRARRTRVGVHALIGPAYSKRSE